MSNELSKQNIHGFREARLQSGVSNSTINKDLNLLFAAINYCNSTLDWKIPTDNKLKKLPEPQGRLRWLTKEEYHCLIEAASSSTKAPYLADVIIIAVNTGLRASELMQLTWDKVQLVPPDNAYILIEQSKSGKRGGVPLNKNAIDAFMRLKEYQRTNCPKARRVITDKLGHGINSIRKSFKHALNEAEIENFTFHDLRHTCASWMVQSGVPILNVKEILRHQDIKMTMRYAHLAPDSGRAAVQALEKDWQEMVTPDEINKVA